MSRGRPRTVLGTVGETAVTDSGRYRASTRHRDLDGRLRKVSATATSKKGAAALLKRRLLDRPGYGSGGVLSLAGPLPDLAELWLADLVRDISEGTRDNYRDDLRLHVRPFFEHNTRGEITTRRPAEPGLTSGAPSGSSWCWPGWRARASPRAGIAARGRRCSPAVGRRRRPRLTESARTSTRVES